MFDVLKEQTGVYTVSGMWPGEQGAQGLAGQCRASGFHGEGDVKSHWRALGRGAI